MSRPTPCPPLPRRSGPLLTSAAGAAVLFTLGALAGCGETAKLPESAGFGPNPQLPEPNKTLIPTVNVAPAKGWPEGGKPTPAAGTAVDAFATGLDHPRWVVVLPNGDVLVAESNKPPKPEGSDSGGIRGWVMKKVMGRAGAVIVVWPVS